MLRKPLHQHEAVRIEDLQWLHYFVRSGAANKSALYILRRLFPLFYDFSDFSNDLYQPEMCDGK